MQFYYFFLANTVFWLDLDLSCMFLCLKSRDKFYNYKKIICNYKIKIYNNNFAVL